MNLYIYMMHVNYFLLVKVQCKIVRYRLSNINNFHLIININNNILQVIITILLLIFFKYMQLNENKTNFYNSSFNSIITILRTFFFIVIYSIVQLIGFIQWIFNLWCRLGVHKSIMKWMYSYWILNILILVIAIIFIIVNVYFFCC